MKKVRSFYDKSKLTQEIFAFMLTAKSVEDIDSYMEDRFKAEKVGALERQVIIWDLQERGKAHLRRQARIRLFHALTLGIFRPKPAPTTA